MRKLFGNPLIQILVLLNLAAMAFLGFRWNSERNATRNAALVRREGEAKGVEAEGWMPATEFKKLQGLRDRTNLSGTIADHDLKWALALTGPDADQSSNALVRRMVVLLHLLGAKNLSAGQKEQVYQATLPLYTAPEVAHADEVRRFATGMALRLQDPRTLPYLRQFAASKDPILANMARKAMAKLHADRVPGA